jgi:plastocyanin
MGNKTRHTANLVSDNNLFVDIANDRVGIGSTQPTAKLNVVGVVSATSFRGDGSQLSGISVDSTSLVDSNSVTRVQATTTGAIVSGILTATKFFGDASNVTGIVTTNLGKANVTIGDNPPGIGTASGDLWWESDTAKGHIYYDDGSSAQWVEFNPSSGGGGGGGGGSYGNSDVDSHLNQGTASSGQILSWNGSDYAWVADQTGGGGGGIALTDLSVTQNSVGTAALSYNNSNGVFSYTPPDLSSYLTSYTETGTLADVTGRGSSTNVDLTFGGGLTVAGVSTFQSSFVRMAPGGGDSGILKLGSGNNYQIIAQSNKLQFAVAAGKAIELNGGNSVYLRTSNTSIDITGGLTVSGVCTATTFSGSGANLTNLPSSQLTGALPAIDGSALTNISGTHSDIVSVWTLGSSGSSDYTLTGPGLTGAENDPTIYLVRGQTYRFTNNSGGSHPFQIRYNSNGTAYSDGVTNNGASSGNIDFNVQYDAPDVLYYQCTNHSGMLGKIIILGDVVNEGSWTASAGAAQTIDTITGVANNAIKTAEYTIHIENGSNMQAQKVLVMQDGTTAFSQEYAIMHKSGLLVSMSATISGGNLLLQATPETGVSGTTTYKVTRQTMR